MLSHGNLTGPSKQPHLLYQTIEYLTATYDPCYFFPEYAYLPFQITTGFEPLVILGDQDGDQDGKEVVPSALPLSDVRESFKQRLNEWESGKTCERIRQVIKSEPIPIDTRITKIVAFANWSLTWDLAISRRSAAQHALMLTLREALADRLHGGDQSKIALYAQDIIYTDVDKQVLQEFGIMVLDDPRGFLEVDDTSVVLSHAPDAPIRDVTANIARPAMMIWDQVVEREPLELDGFPRSWYAPNFTHFFPFRTDIAGRIP